MKLIDRCITCSHLQYFEFKKLFEIRKQQPNVTHNNHCKKLKLYTTGVNIYSPEEFGCIFWEEKKDASLAI